MPSSVESQVNGAQTRYMDRIGQDCGKTLKVDGGSSLDISRHIRLEMGDGLKIKL